MRDRTGTLHNCVEKDWQKLTCAYCRPLRSQSVTLCSNESKSTDVKEFKWSSQNPQLTSSILRKSCATERTEKLCLGMATRSLVQNVERGMLVLLNQLHSLLPSLFARLGTLMLSHASQLGSRSPRATSTSCLAILELHLSAGRRVV